MTLSFGGLLKNKYNPYLIIGFIFFIKLLSVLYLIHLSKCLAPSFFSGLASMTGDASSYITPIDNYINEGSYYFGSAKAGRMPYVGIVYYLFRLLFEKNVALSIVVILQVLMESIAIYYTAKLCAGLFKNRKAFWVFIFLSLLSLNITFFDFYILSESFGISFLCLFAYQYYTYLSGERSNKKLVLTGLFLALTILFKPYFSLLFIFMGAELLWHYRRFKLSDYAKKILTSSIIVSIPIIVLDAPWVVRNYKLFNKFIPFQQNIYAGYPFPPASQAYITFIKTIGESFTFWDTRSAGCYFEPQEAIPCIYKFPKRIFSADLTMRDIEEARNLYLAFRRNPTDSLENLTVNKFNLMTETYKRDHKFSYYFLTPLILCKNFLIHSGSYYMPVKKGSECYHSYQWALKILQSLLYYLAFTAGFAGLIFMFLQDKRTYMLLLIPLYLVIFFPLGLRATEFRYFAPSYPFLILGVSYFCFRFYDYGKKLFTRKAAAE